MRKMRRFYLRGRCQGEWGADWVDEKKRAVDGRALKSGSIGGVAGIIPCRGHGQVRRGLGWPSFEVPLLWLRLPSFSGGGA